jgi:tryptophan 2,3-dioxygenase
LYPRRGTAKAWIGKAFATSRVDARPHDVEHSDMPPLTYASYLDLEKLLTLQKPRSSPPEHDETLFIIIHQTYELWFKQLLHEFEKIQRDFSAGDLFGAIHTFKRVRTIMKVLVAQVDILETMTPSGDRVRVSIGAVSGD